MTPNEKYLAHQIHPLKLLTDWWCWVHRAQPVVATRTGGRARHHTRPAVRRMRYVNLEPYRQSAFGRDVARSMTHAMAAARLVGFIVNGRRRVVSVGARVVLGVVVVLTGRLRGVFVPNSASTR